MHSELIDTGSTGSVLALLMIADTLKKIEEARAKLATLEADAARDLNKELAVLHEQYGFATTKAFVKAVKVACGLGRRAVGAKAGKRKRAVITDAMRSQVRKLAEAGKTGAQIAAAVGVSVPTVQNIKKMLGLVKVRK